MTTQQNISIMPKWSYGNNYKPNPNGFAEMPYLEFDGKLWMSDDEAYQTQDCKQYCQRFWEVGNEENKIDVYWDICNTNPDETDESNMCDWDEFVEVRDEIGKIIWSK